LSFFVEEREERRRREEKFWTSRPVCTDLLGKSFDDHGIPEKPSASAVSILRNFASLQHTLQYH
jgi:hypothetical protein